MRDLGWDVPAGRREPISKFLTELNIPMLEFWFDECGITLVDYL
jgi:hypothetical protein